MLLGSILTLSIAMILQGCGRGNGGCDPDPEPEEILFSTSFESEVDTVGWTGYGDVWLAEDAPPGGGLQALGVGGGCEAPHAVYVLGPMEVGGRYAIRCWGREVVAPGHVELRLAGDYEGKSVGFTVEGHDWVEYSTGGCIWCASGRSLEIDVISGGFAGVGGVVLDLLEVVRIRP
jgi:hypothetical protein